MRDPYYVLFQLQGKLEHLRSLLGTLLRNAYTLHNPLYEVQKQFDLLYTHPKVPFQVRQLDKHVHIVYIRYMYRKFLLRVT